MNATQAYGIDVVLAIDPESYEITVDARGRAYAFELNDATRAHLTQAVKTVLAELQDDRGMDVSPRDVVKVDPQPGYLRVRLEPTESPDISAQVARRLRRVARVYNQRHAESVDLDGFRFGDWFVSVYRPEGAPTAEAFLDHHVDDDAVPDAEGPVYEFERDRREHNVGGNARIGYRFLLPWDADMYAKGGDVNRRYPFEWDAPTLERFEKVVNWRENWPSTTTRVVAYPGHLEVRTVDMGLGRADAAATRIHQAVAAYNATRGVHPDLGGPGVEVLRPKLALTDAVYIEALPPAEGGADEWIAEHRLGDADGEPREPERDARRTVEDGGSGWGVPNPFGD